MYNTIDSLQELESEVWRYVETLRNSPEARLKSRDAFYKKYGVEDKADKYGYGDSEIAFFGWEERTVLRPPGANPPGSEWWSDVNLWFIYLSELGGKAYAVKFPKAQLPAPAAFWATFIEQPSSISWYRAHNASIIDGYLKYPRVAEKETIPEKVFINKVLYRLLFAQSLVEGKFIFPKLAKILGDPRGGAVKFITSIDEYYPDHYPMTEEEINEVFGKTHGLGELSVKFLDDVLIAPALIHLYQMASNWNKQPALHTLIADQKPAYPYGIHLPDTKKGWLIKLFVWLRKIFFKN